MNCKPYLEILEDLGYKLLNKDSFTSTYDPNNPDDEDVFITSCPIYIKGEAKVELCLEVNGSRKVSNFLKDKDPKKLEMTRLWAYYSKDDKYPLNFFKVSTRSDDSGIQDIEEITPKVFKTILKIKSTPESEYEHTHKVILRYLDLWNNIITPIVNPVAKFKNLTYYPSIDSGFYINPNRNIGCKYKSGPGNYVFEVGINYVTLQSYFIIYPDTNYIMYNFEDIITTKGRLLELLKDNGI